MNRSQIKDFTHGSIMPQLIIFSLPLFLSNFLQIVYNMVDMVIVGKKLGLEGISGVSVGGDVTALLNFIAIGFASAGQVLIARYIGAGERHKIGKFVGTMFSFLFTCAIVISILGFLFRNELLMMMNTPDESWDEALSYSVICMMGLVFIYGYNIVSAILRGMGDSKHPFIFIAVAAAINVILDILFVMKLEMGAGGAALATVISQAVSFIACSIFLIKKRKEFALEASLYDFFRWDKEMLSDLLKLGTPMAIKMASVQISKLFVNSFINSYGKDISAFAGIANKISNVSNLISSAMNTAGSTMVGQNLAAEKYDRVKKILLRLALVTLSLAVVFSAAIIFFSDEIFTAFIDSENASDAELILGIGEKYVPIAILLFFGGALRALMNALINGSGNTIVNFTTAIFDGIILRIGLSVLFGLVLDMKHYGFWLGDALAGFTPFWIGLIFYFTGAWKKPRKRSK